MSFKDDIMLGFAMYGAAMVGDYDSYNFLRKQITK